MRKNETEFIPLNDGMEIHFPPKPRFHEDEKYTKFFKKKDYSVRVTQISQTKVRAFVSLGKLGEEESSTTASGVGGFVRSEHFDWEAAKQAAFENAVAKLSE